MHGANMKNVRPF